MQLGRCGLQGSNSQRGVPPGTGLMTCRLVHTARQVRERYDTKSAGLGLAFTHSHHILIVSSPLLRRVGGDILKGGS